MGATVVWCQTCKTAVWAYDDMRAGQDVRGLMNMIGMPCPKCGKVGNFDGWTGDDLEWIRSHAEAQGIPVFDWWSALKAMVQLEAPKGTTWEISPDCGWFKRPEYADDEESTLLYSAVLPDLCDNIQEAYNNHGNIEALKDVYPVEE